MSADRNFDNLSKRFKNNIYGTAKGIIRLAVINEDLEQVVFSETKGSKLKILDAGGGQGHLAFQLANEGHELVICDISEQMLKEAQARFSENETTTAARFVHSSIQDLPEHITEKYDLVLCHAVLEWVAEQKQLLADLVSFMQPGGYLSLMFYNRHGAVYRNLLRGNFRKVESNDFTGHKNSLTPRYPLEPCDVYQWLEQLGLKIIRKSGIRTFYDYLPRDIRDSRSLEDALSLEMRFAHQQPYLEMARYIHLIATFS